MFLPLVLLCLASVAWFLAQFLWEARYFRQRPCVCLSGWETQSGIAAWLWEGTQSGVPIAAYQINHHISSPNLSTIISERVKVIHEGLVKITKADPSTDYGNLELYPLSPIHFFLSFNHKMLEILFFELASVKLRRAPTPACLKALSSVIGLL